MLLDVATPMHMIAPIRAGTLTVVPRGVQHPEDAGHRPGQGRQDDERVEPRLEVHHHQEVDQQHGEHQPGRQPGNELFMLSTWPRITIVLPRGSSGLGRVDDLLHVGRDAARSRPCTLA